MTTLALIVCLTLALIICESVGRLADIAREQAKARSEARRTVYRIRAYEDVADRTESVEGRARALAISYSLRAMIEEEWI